MYRFEVVQYRDFEFQTLAEEYEGTEHEEMNNSNVAQVLALKPKSSSSTDGIIITNTHLYWNWK